MNNAGFLIYLIMIAVPAICNAQDLSPMKDVAGFRDRLEKMSADVTTISSDFIQEKNLAVFSEKIISKGHFVYRNDNKIRWEYTSPYRYLIIINNDQLYTSTEGNSKVYDIQANRMFQEMNKFMSSFIRGDILRNEKDYTPQFFENTSHYYVKLTPVSTRVQQMLTGIDIWFDKNDFSVAGIRLTEPGDDYTKIDFTNRKLNTEITGEKFTF
jgi:outer membrane lipoprotein-sorting protein